MSLAGIKLATTQNTLIPAALAEDDISNKVTITAHETDNALLAKNSSVCSLPLCKEQQLPVGCEELYLDKVPLENATVENRPHNGVSNSKIATHNSELEEYQVNDVEQVDLESTAAQLSPGLSLLQQTAAASSPPPHSYRHSRAYRHFKNPPQPHMCIRTTTEIGEELFINVLSWTRIVIPQEPSDPIPLYGGMRVPPGNPRSPPLVFAVMANPEVLKDSGRQSKDPEERRAMVELMCDFVEAMNPGVKLVRNAVILKDRDISGELKDVWNAVQAQRDREREEQILLQRQQHQNHFHNISNPSTNSSLASNTLISVNNSVNIMASTQQIFSTSLHCVTDDDTLSAGDGEISPESRKFVHRTQNDSNEIKKNGERDMGMLSTNNGQMSLDTLSENFGKNLSVVGGSEQIIECNTKQQHNQITNEALSNQNNSKDNLEVEKNSQVNINNQLNSINCHRKLKKQHPILTNGSVINSSDIDASNVNKPNVVTDTPNADISNPNPSKNPPISNSPPSTTQQAPTKKEKLGFLPNGCIFPRFSKNNKHKDKDKEPKTKDKEKNVLLSALKKSKDKKSNTTSSAAVNNASANSQEKISSSISKTAAANCNQTINKQQSNNCLQQLECGIQKLDLNNHLSYNHVAEININNTASNISTNKNSTSSTSNASGVGVR